MSDTRECPQCGGTMRLTLTRTGDHVPGHPTATTRTTVEWLCPDCDYFEEAEEEKA